MAVHTDSSTTSMISLRGLTKTFDKTIHAVRDFDLEIAEGEVVVIVGPSGSGKSTVLRCINLLEIPTEGFVTVDGFELTDVRTDPADGPAPRLVGDDMVNRPLNSAHNPRHGRSYLFGIRIASVDDSLR